MVMIMKSLNVVPADKSVRRSLQGVAAVWMVFVSGSVFSAEHVISKTNAPTSVLVLSLSDIYPATGFSSFYVNSPDIPAGTLILPKKLLEIQWNTTYYPKTIRDDVELCYYRPFSSQKTCETIRPNASGDFKIFNDQAFGHGSRVVINHSVLGGEPPFARPAGVDSVKFKYQY